MLDYDGITPIDVKLSLGAYYEKYDLAVCFFVLSLGKVDLLVIVLLIFYLVELSNYIEIRFFYVIYPLSLLFKNSFYYFENKILLLEVLFY